MGRAQRGPAAISAADFTAVFGSRRGRKPGEERPPEPALSIVNDDPVCAYNRRLAEMLVAAAPESFAQVDALEKALKQLNSLPCNSEDDSTVQLLNAIAESCFRTTEAQYKEYRVYEVERCLGLKLAWIPHLDDIEMQSRDQTLAYLSSMFHGGEALTPAHCSSNADAYYRKATSQVLAHEIYKQQTNRRPGPAQTLLGQEAYRQLRRESGGVLRRSDPEKFLTELDWEKLLSRLDMKFDRDELAAEVTRKVRWNFRTKP